MKKINESENQLMQALSNAFGKDKLFSRNFKDRFNEDFFNKCYNIFNKYFFFSKLDKIPIFYKSDNYIRNFLIDRKANKNDIPDLFFGTHTILYDNDPKTLKMTDTLIIHDDIILLNMDHIENKSLVFAIACLCHEMIHYYDRLFGEYCTFTKFSIINNIRINTHNTPTFEDMKDKANELGINVIQEIPRNKNSKILDREAIELLFTKLQNGDMISEEENHFMVDNPNTIVTKFDDNAGGCIITF